MDSECRKNHHFVPVDPPPEVGPLLFSLDVPGSYWLNEAEIDAEFNRGSCTLFIPPSYRDLSMTWHIPPPNRLLEAGYTENFNRTYETRAGSLQNSFRTIEGIVVVSKKSMKSAVISFVYGETGTRFLLSYQASRALDLVFNYDDVLWERIKTLERQVEDLTSRLNSHLHSNTPPYSSPSLPLSRSISSEGALLTSRSTIVCSPGEVSAALGGSLSISRSASSGPPVPPRRTSATVARCANLAATTFGTL